MKSHPTLASVALEAALDLRRSWRSLIVFQLAFQAFRAWLMLPAVALLLAITLQRTGRVAVSNFDLLDFLLTPEGLIYAAVFLVLSVVLFLLEQAGIMAVVQGRRSHRFPSSTALARHVLGRMITVGRLGLLSTLAVAAMFAPLVLIAMFTYGALLSQHDIYFYWKLRPAEFWWAIGIGLVLLTLALSGALVMVSRWALALPIVVFEANPASTAIGASRRRSLGLRRLLVSIVGLWLLGISALGALLATVLRWGAAAVLAVAGSQNVIVMALLLFVQGGLLMIWGFVTSVGLALCVRRVYLVRREHPASPELPTGDEPWTDWISAAWVHRVVTLVLLLVAIAPLSVWAGVAYTAGDPKLVAITAHRGHSRQAPENTLAAFEKAIESGADYVELDIHQTADGEIMVLHDRDLKRVAGLSRRLAELTLDEVRQLDVGTWFDPAFSNERVPTLREAIAVCRGRIRMNIEIKVFNRDLSVCPPLAALLADEDFEDECLITSLDDRALFEMQRLNPRLATGIIVAQSLGDVTRWPFDVLSIRAEHLTDAVLRSAHRRGMEVHVWTVNRPETMLRLMQRGVDNLITSDPDLALRVRRGWLDQSDAERLVLSARLLLGLPPP